MVEFGGFALRLPISDSAHYNTYVLYTAETFQGKCKGFLPAPERGEAGEGRPEPTSRERSGSLFGH